MGPLEGLKVIELGQLIAGPFCTRVMAEFGAQVIKIESPRGGDPLRQLPSRQFGNPVVWLSTISAVIRRCRGSSST